MLSAAENETLTQTGPGTAMGELLRRFWLPALLPDELPTPDGVPVRVRLDTPWRDGTRLVAGQTVTVQVEEGTAAAGPTRTAQAPTARPAE